MMTLTFTKVKIMYWHVWICYKTEAWMLHCRTNDSCRAVTRSRNSSPYFLICLEYFYVVVAMICGGLSLIYSVRRTKLFSHDRSKIESDLNIGFAGFISGWTIKG